MVTHEYAGDHFSQSVKQNESFGQETRVVSVIYHHSVIFGVKKCHRMCAHPC